MFAEIRRMGNEKISAG